MTPLTNATVFLVQTLFDLYIFVLLVRVILQYLRASYHNPLCQFVVKLTDPVVKPFQRFVPGYKGIDIAILIPIILLQIIEIFLLTWLQANTIPGLLGAFIWAIGSLLNQVFNIYFYAIFIWVILSWVSSTRYNPANEILYLIISPILKPLQRTIPPIGHFDISPIVAVILIKLIDIVFINTIIAYGVQIALNQ